MVLSGGICGVELGGYGVLSGGICGVELGNCEATD